MAAAAASLRISKEAMSLGSMSAMGLTGSLVVVLRSAEVTGMPSTTYKGWLLADTEADVIALEMNVAPLLDHLKGIDDQVTAVESQLAALQTQATDFDGRVALAQSKLRDLEAQKKQNKDAIAAQRTALANLVDQRGQVYQQLSALDKQIALAGCTT